MRDVVWKVWKTLLKNGEMHVSVGKEVAVELKSGEQVVLVCEQVKDGKMTFFTKDLLEDTHCMNENWGSWALGNGININLSSMDDYLKRVFHLLPDDLQDVICDGQLRLLTEREVYGVNILGEKDEREQLPRYKDDFNRIKHLRGVPFSYWVQNRSAGEDRDEYFCVVEEDGFVTRETAYTGCGVCFGFEI